MKSSGGAQKVVPGPAAGGKIPDLAPDQLEELMSLQTRFKVRLDDIVGNWNIYVSPEPFPLKEELMILKRDIATGKPVGQRLVSLSQNEEFLKLAQSKPVFRRLNDQLGELLRWMWRL